MGFKKKLVVTLYNMQLNITVYHKINGTNVLLLYLQK